MSCHTGVHEWADVIATHLPQLTKPQVTVLAWWSYGMVLARSCALTAVTVMLAALLQAKENTVRQRLREFAYEAAAKRGGAADRAGRRELLAAVARLGAGRLVQPAAGAGARPDDAGRPLRGPDREHPLP